MSLDVSPALLEAAERGPVGDAEFAETVRLSLPYAWEAVSAAAADLHSGTAPFGEHREPPTDAERGQLLRALASDAIRGVLERHFAVRLAFQNCHRVGAFRPADVNGEVYARFISPRAQLLNQSPDFRGC
jgi:hypothetical protein